MADGYFNFDNIDTSSIDDYRQHAQELSSYTNSEEGSDDGGSDSPESESEEKVTYARSRQIQEIDEKQNKSEDESSSFAAPSVPSTTQNKKPNAVMKKDGK